MAFSPENYFFRENKREIKFFSGTHAPWAPAFLNKMKTKIQNSQKNLIQLGFLAVFMNLYTLSLLLATLARFVSVNFEINFKKPFV